MPPWINPSNPLQGAQNAVDSTVGAGQDAVRGAQDFVVGGTIDTVGDVAGGTQDFVGDTVDGPANFVNATRDRVFDVAEDVVDETGQTAQTPFWALALAAVGVAIAVFGFGGDS